MMECVLRLDTLLSEGRKAGFDAVGVAPVEKLTQEREILQQWLDDGCQAGMAYMSRNLEKREDVSLLVPD
ncbi:MAG: tRNA epoxyqueuosine(34) reductase QueG, partial [Odoribacter sp.]|nr:tRNA epoxyqueuosine(34) reductase QueG [Odoribacter sp.]